MAKKTSDKKTQTDSSEPSHTDKLSDMSAAVKKITVDRGWQKYHNPKNMAMDLVREASEALDHLVWDKSDEPINDPQKRKAIGKELADVLHSLLLFADAMDLDLAEQFWSKLKEVRKRYPVDKIYGTSGYDYKRLQQQKKEDSD